MRPLLLLLSGVPIAMILSIALLTEKRPRLPETRPSWYLLAKSDKAALLLLTQLTAA